MRLSGPACCFLTSFEKNPSAVDFCCFQQLTGQTAEDVLTKETWPTSCLTMLGYIFPHAYLCNKAKWCTSKGVQESRPQLLSPQQRFAQHWRIPLKFLRHVFLLLQKAIENIYWPYRGDIALQLIKACKDYKITQWKALQECKSVL